MISTNRAVTNPAHHDRVRVLVLLLKVLPLKLLPTTNQNHARRKRLSSSSSLNVAHRWLTLGLWCVACVWGRPRENEGCILTLCLARTLRMHFSVSFYTVKTGRVARNACQQAQSFRAGATTQSTK